MSEIDDASYELRNLREQDRLVALIQAEYDRVINQLSPLIAANAVQSLIDRRLNELLLQATKNITVHIQASTAKSWALSHERTFAYIKKAEQHIALPPSVRKIVYDPNARALEQFQKGKVKGLTLSERVWKTTERFNSIVEEIQEKGISEGRSAVKIARELRKELANPTTNEAPGRGVYKSPVKNTERLARTENNMSYRKADGVAWSGNPMILGCKIQLSNTNSKKVKARCELCVQMQGDYPVTFEWTGWHPHCLCFKTPILMSREYLTRYNQLIAKGEDTAEGIAALRKEAGEITDPPIKLREWVAANAERVAGWKSKPYWWSENLKVMGGI